MRSKRLANTVELRLLLGTSFATTYRAYVLGHYNMEWVVGGRKDRLERRLARPLACAIIAVLKDFPDFFCLGPLESTFTGKFKVWHLKCRWITGSQWAAPSCLTKRLDVRDAAFGKR